MITRSRVAAIVSASVLCVGFAAAPAAFAAQTDSTVKSASTSHKHKAAKAKAHRDAGAPKTAAAPATK